MMFTRQSALDGERDRQDDHESFISHGINDAAGDGLELPFPRQPAIDEIREASIREQA